MIRKLALVLTLIGGLVAGIVPALAQNPQFPNNIGGQFIASEYGKWSATSLTAMTANTASTINFFPCFQKVGTGNRQVFPFWQAGSQALNVPIQIQDGSSSELITTESAAAFPSAAPVSYPQPYVCSITVTPANSHAAGVTFGSGDGGLAEAINDAISSGAGPVILDASFGGYNPNLAVVYANVQILDLRGPYPQYWNPAPSTTTLLAAPTVLSAQAACDATHTFCSDATVAGSASWATAVYGCITLVDIMGNESPCSATANFVPVASKAIDIGAPTSVSSNVVGWKPYLSVANGSYALAYSIPLLTQPTTLDAVPVSTGVCTLTTLETVTPACAIANTAYGQLASTTGAAGLFSKGGAQVTGYPVVTSTLAPEIGSVSATAYNPNEEAHATYVYTPSARATTAGPQSGHIVFPITAAAQTTVGEVMGSFPLPAQFMNYAGRTVEVCGLISKTSTVADTVDDIQIWWDAEGSNVSAGTPVQLSSIKLTSTGTAAFTINFCQQLITTVASTSATGGTITPGQAWLTKSQVSAGTVPVAAAGSLVAAVGSLNLSLPAHLSVMLSHTTGTDGAGATLLGATIRVIN